MALKEKQLDFLLEDPAYAFVMDASVTKDEVNRLKSAFFPIASDIHFHEDREKELVMYVGDMPLVYICHLLDLIIKRAKYTKPWRFVRVRESGDIVIRESNK